MQLNINTTAVVKLTNKLDKINRSALPIAVRDTLNAAAKDMKQSSILDAAAISFVHRVPTFFKATSKINFASGYNINSMQAAVGFSGSSQAIEDLEQQEHGGMIKGRSFIATDAARVGKSRNKKIRPNMRINTLQRLVDAKKAPGKSDAEKFINSVIFAGVGGNVLSTYKGKQVVWRVNSLKRVDKKWDLKLTKIYTFVSGRSVQIKKATHFMENASMITSKKMDAFYLVAAEKQFKRALA